MISNHLGSAYPSPTSAEFVQDYQELVKTRMKITQQSAKSYEDKIQRNIDPKLTEIFNQEAKTAIDLYA
ncbi:MAG: hypothetical protein OEX12_08565 [Gammaproteobacteria bacterium]|nr:hypothetical protein [Gammaproteobacteria bacterium]